MDDRELRSLTDIEQRKFIAFWVAMTVMEKKGSGKLHDYVLARLARDHDAQHFLCRYPEAFGKGYRTDAPNYTSPAYELAQKQVLSARPRPADKQREVLSLIVSLSGQISSLWRTSDRPGLLTIKVLELSCALQQMPNKNSGLAAYPDEVRANLRAMQRVSEELLKTCLVAPLFRSVGSKQKEGPTLPTLERFDRGIKASHQLSRLESATEQVQNFVDNVPGVPRDSRFKHWLKRTTRSGAR